VSAATPNTRPIVIASNRGPLSFFDDGGELRARRGAGGLVSGLLPLVSGTDTVWIAAAMSDADRRAADSGVVSEDGVRAQVLDLPADDFRAAYDVVGNATLWFAHHGLFDTARRPRIDRHWRAAWAAYQRVNAAFAEAIAQTAPEGAVVLVQDYHLALVAPLLMARRPDVAAVHFSHTPFAGPDLLRVLPRDVRVELLEGMATHRACGFHTARWANAFEHACREDGVQAARTFVASLGPDPDDLARAASSPACDAARARLADTVGDRRLVVRVDRLELSKNLVRGFLAYDALLEEHPEHRETTTFAAFVYPSREGLPEYLAYRQEVEATVRRITQRWGTSTWQPIILDISDDYPTSVAALRAYDVLLVNPVRDGLNLVAKEGPVVNERDGVVALSTEAGAFAELEPAVLAVDPCDVEGTADVLHRALTLDAGSRSEQASRLRALALARGPAAWLDDQLTAAG
jgi:trehalose 6-phosphate synthase